MTPEEQDATISAIRLRLVGRKPPIKVLLVEDNENDAAMTMKVLRDFGVEVIWAKDSEETTRFMSENDPWLVLLDLHLGAHDREGELGLNVLSLIKSFRPGCGVVILTGVHKHSQNCLKALANGADAVMSKPLTEKQVQFIFCSP